MIKIDIIAGARPNFMKISPIIKEINNVNLKSDKIQYRLIHTGQHYDDNMSESFFDQLKIPKPQINLNSGSGTQSEQTSKIMIGYEKALNDELPNYCLVVGDVNSTLGCSIVAKKMGIKVIHVEGGIRSGDMCMPEEINRIVTDSITDYFFTTSKTANKNLVKEGKNEKNIFFVGNTMIDTLLTFKKNFSKPYIWDKFKLSEKKYFILTLHRPSNVDDKDLFKNIIREIINSANGFTVIYPAHPRTIKNLSEIKIDFEKLKIVEPLSYLEFNYLVSRSLAVITDSGGITEETTVLNIPCITLRDSTERPETVTEGTNVLVGTDPKKIAPEIKKIVNGKWKKGTIPELWDGNASKRIIDYILSFQ